MNSLEKKYSFYYSAKKKKKKHLTFALKCILQPKCCMFTRQGHLATLAFIITRLWALISSLSDLTYKQTLTKEVVGHESHWTFLRSTNKQCISASGYHTWICTILKGSDLVLLWGLTKPPSSLWVLSFWNTLKAVQYKIHYYAISYNILCELCYLQVLYMLNWNTWNTFIFLHTLSFSRNSIILS